MRVLLNYDSAEKDRLSAIAYILRNAGVNALSTSHNLSISELMAKARIANCDAILCSNSQTLRSLVPGDKPSLDAWRGTRLNFEVPVIVINSLAHIHTVPHGKWLMERDILKLRYTLIKPKPFSYNKLLDVDSFPAAFSRLSKAHYISYDVETKTLKPPADSLAGGDTYITCGSWTGIFANGEIETFVLPLVDYEGDHWKSDRDYTKALRFLQKTNALPQPKIMHNGMYDVTHSLRYHAPPINYLFDTMAIAHSEYSELPKDLAFLCSYMLYDYVFWKHDAETAAKRKDQEMYWGYNGKDTWNTARAFMAQMRTSQPHAFTNYARQFPTVFPSLYSNFEGFKIDQAKRSALRETAEIKLLKARSKLRTMFADENFNAGSWQQVEKYVYSVFGAKKPKVGKSASGTDEKNLKVVATQHPLLARIVEEILDYRESQKAIGTYFDFLQYKGRLLWALNPFGTDTTRMACSASSLWVGTQVQNIPGYAKPMLIADEGFEVFEADNKQSEGRTTAYCSQEEALIAALEDAHRDFYKTLGTLFFDIPYEEVTDFFRNKVLKKIVHGTNYMMGAGTFIENIGARILFETAAKLGITIVEIARANRPDERTLKQFAKDLLDAYHKPFPGVRSWYNDIKQEIRNTGRLVSPTGHVRVFFGDIDRDHSMLRGAVAHQPQNLSVEILNIGFKRAYKEIVLPSNGDFRIKAQIHDSIMGQWRISRRDEFAARLADCMYNPVNVHGRTLVIPIDIKYGQNWGEADESNPTGTVKYKRK